MSVLSAVVSFNVTTQAAANTVTVDTLSFVPKVLIFRWTRRTESGDASGRQTWDQGVGFCAGTTKQTCVYSACEDNVADSNAFSAYSSIAMIGAVTPGGVSQGLMALQSFESDGFIMVINEKFENDMRVSCLALGGDDITDTAIGRENLGSGTGPFVVTAPGFQGDVALFLCCMSNSSSASGTFGSGAFFSFGAATAAGSEGVTCFGVDDGPSTGKGSSYQRGDECIAGIAANESSVQLRVSFTSWDVNGFTLNKDEMTATNRRFHYLVIKGGSYLVSNFLTATDTDPFSQTGVGYKSSSVLFAGCGRAESSPDSHSGDAELSIGFAASPTERSAQYAYSDNGPATTEVFTAIEHDEVYLSSDIAESIDRRMDLTAMGSDGFTNVMCGSDLSASFVMYLASGPAAAVGGLSIPVAMHHRKMAEIS